MLGRKNLMAALIGFSIATLLICYVVLAGEVRASWQDEWGRTVKAAELEGEAVFYSLAEIGDVFVKNGFQKRFPKIKISVVGARNGEHMPRIIAARKTGKFLV